MIASTTVPVANEKNAACWLPIALPSPELIGPCRATRPPTTAVSATATPRSTTWRPASSGRRPTRRPPVSRLPAPPAGRPRARGGGGGPPRAGAPPHRAARDLARLLGLLG